MKGSRSGEKHFFPLTGFLFTAYFDVSYNQYCLGNIKTTGTRQITVSNPGHCISNENISNIKRWTANKVMDFFINIQLFKYSTFN